MPRVNVSVMIQDFLKINDPTLVSITKRDHDNSYDVSGEVFNHLDQKATIEYQKIWYITKTLKGFVNASDYNTLATLNQSPKKYNLIIPEHCLPKLDSEEDRALYRIKVLCINYLTHVYEVIDKNIREYNQKLDKKKAEFHREIDDCTDFLKKHPQDTFFIMYQNRQLQELKDLDVKYITNDCSEKRMQGIKEQIKNSYSDGLWLKESVFCEMFHAKTIKKVAQIIKNNKLRLSTFRKTAVEEEYDFLEFFKIIAIIMTFPVAISILAAVSYKRRGTLYFYKPDSEICVDKIQEEIRACLH